VSKYPNYEVYRNNADGCWLWRINLSHKTALDCNWQYRTFNSAHAAAKRNFRRRIVAKEVGGESVSTIWKI